MAFAKLQRQVKKLEPSLSEEGLIELFMPFCEALVKENDELKVKINSLEDKLAVNSANSSKPPSKDDFKPPKNRSLRKKSGKKPGGQHGHKGRGADLRENPDEIISYQVATCPNCAIDLRGVAADGIMRRQVEDIPPMETIVTEHQIEWKTCSAIKKDGSVRGRTAQSKTVNLLWRLSNKEDQVLRFMTHQHACFDNNQAERDLNHMRLARHPE